MWFRISNIPMFVMSENENEITDLPIQEESHLLNTVILSPSLEILNSWLDQYKKKTLDFRIFSK